MGFYGHAVNCALPTAAFAEKHDAAMTPFQEIKASHRTIETNS